MAGFSFKIQHGEIVRKISVPESVNWAGLESLIQARFQLGDETKFVLTYTDQDGDSIAVSSDDELAEMMSGSVAPYRLKIKLLDKLNSQSSATSIDSDLDINYDSLSISTHQSESAPPSIMAQPSPDLAASVVWSELDKDELDVRSSTPTSTAQGLDEIAAEAELYVNDALADHSPFDDPEDSEISPEDAPPLHSTSFADPDDDTGAPTPETTRTDSPLPNTFPLPPSIATFLSGLPHRADSLSSHLTSLLSEPATAPLRSLFATAPQSVEDLPVLARTFAGELNNLLGSALSGVRDEANQLRGEFEALKVNLAQDKQDLEDRLRREWDDAVAQEKARRGQGQQSRERETDEQTEVGDEKGEDAAEAEAEAAEVNEKGLPMDPASRAARKQQRHEARLARKALRHAQKREVKRAQRVSKAASSIAESVAAPAAAAAEVTPGLAGSSTYNPYDDFCAELAPSEVSEVASTLTRVSSPPPLIGAYPALPTFPSLETGPAATPAAISQSAYLHSDDLFHRRVSGPRAPMPGAFNPSVAAYTQPAVDRNASAGYFVGNSTLSRANTMPAPATAAAPRMPGAFASGPAEGGDSSLFAGFVSRPSAPLQEARWAEVTPEQVKAEVARLGFDLRDLGTRIAAERAWEELRGKTLAEMVACCVDKLV